MDFGIVPYSCAHVAAAAARLDLQTPWSNIMATCFLAVAAIVYVEIQLSC